MHLGVELGDWLDVVVPAGLLSLHSLHLDLAHLFFAASITALVAIVLAHKGAVVRLR